MSAASDHSTAKPNRRLWPFVVWLISFCLFWFTLVTLNGHWAQVQSHWGIAVAMLLGSYVAGSTPMGGGTVGFPVLVLLFELPGAIGRNFGLAIQSVGMVSASIFILCNRTAVATSLVRPTFLGTLVGMPIGAVFVAPIVSDIVVKLLFAVIWASFGLLHLAKLKEFISYSGMRRRTEGQERWTGLTTGVLGGVVASLTGVGIDMMLYVALVLLYRCDLKLAIPSSVLVMAFASVVGTLCNLVLAFVQPQHYSYDPEVYYCWLAAAPVVIIGAPLGALVVERIPRGPTLVFVSCLCVVQYVWTAVHEQIDATTFAVSIAGIGLFNAVFYLMYRIGKSR